MKNYVTYIIRQKDGIILGESEELSEAIKQLAYYKLQEIERYNYGSDEKIEYERYPYMNGLYKLFKNADYYNINNFEAVKAIYNNAKHVCEDEYIELETTENKLFQDLF
ncbi:hypothetical protein [Staphylococcus pseudintermedius]|uniref:hypothetical protein n=1 Tax=Staphylococcus pseudintermedius TaxID=283734 RepID=UPI00111D0430|nr:hypothetical protein [Staphylococcus pseudintermedius]EGQ2703029.1 hypothetical protein [Staphylococcus pseudintermedius]EGQ3154367.1 hypothetical protein [Staphylococcus pseudintermedius]EGQ3173021.1 hypothetical protein [Staphylococcus pseudintermedius]EGQ3229916.1 hypothetical protein [Staphylococcus pseudintermedius]EGQ4153750.1 hypothetical protein [Staphylococcus pseudintermedius]